jgi:hypothetical protein
LGMHLFTFFIAHSIYNMERVIMDRTRNFYCMDELWKMLIPSVGILHVKWTCTWSWSQSMKRLSPRLHNLTILNKVTSRIWIKFCNTTHMALVGIYHHWETFLHYFVTFCQIKTPDFKHLLEKKDHIALITISKLTTT